MIRDIESHLGHKILRAHSCSPETRDGYYPSWNGYYDEDDNYIECYDENISQPIDAVRLNFYKKGNQLFEIACYSHVFDIWVRVEEFRFPYAFGWFRFLKHFLGFPSDDIPRDEQVRQDTYKVLQFYKEVLAPFHPTIFIAHGEEDSWIELAEDGKCSLEDLLNYRINDKYKPIPVNKETPFTYDSDYGTDEEYSVLVFVERFDYKKRLLKIDSLIIIADSRRI